MNLIDLHCDTLWKLMDLGGEGDLLENDGSVSIRTLEEEEKIRPEYYQIQVGAYVSCQVAEEITMELMEQGYPAFYIYQDGYYKVRVGAFLNLDNGANMEMRLRQNGWPTMMVLEPAVY